MEEESSVAREIDGCYNHLEQQTLVLHSIWSDFKILFGHSEERIQLLNRTAGSFFGDCQIVFRDYLFLGICRLTDSKGSGSRTNVTFSRLISLMPNHSDMAMAMQPMLQTIESKVRPIRSWRDKRIAHADLHIALFQRENPLPGISNAQVEELLGLMAKFLNVYSRSVKNTTMLYDEISKTGGADRLVVHLENGLAGREERMRLKSGGTTS